MAVLDPNNGQNVKTPYANQMFVKVVDGAGGAQSTKFINVVNDGDTLSAGVNDAGNPTMFKSTDGKHREGLCDSVGHPLVAIVPVQGTSNVVDYLAFTTTATMVPAATIGGTATAQVHSKTITASKTAMNVKVAVASAGALVKWDIGTNNGTTFTILKTVITSAARPTYDVGLSATSLTAPGTGTFAIQVNGTNLDVLGPTADGYSTLEWTEM